MFLMLAAAFAAPSEEVAEEIIVWGQPFERFNDKRWLVRSEVIAPTPQQFGTSNHVFRAKAWQLEAIVHCNLDEKPRSLREAECSIERASVRVVLPRVRKGDNEALLKMSQQLQGASIQLQVNSKGRVPNLDLNGLPANNERQQDLALSNRTMIAQIAAAFHMELPTVTNKGAAWVSNREPLLAIASVFPGMSSVEVAHTITPQKDFWLQQTQGRATSTSPVPNPRAGMPCFRLDPDMRCPRNPINGEPLRSNEADYLTDLEFMYALQINGVSVIDPNLGYPTERVWNVLGQPTASSPGEPGDYWAAGKMRELAKDEVVLLGPTKMIDQRGKKGAQANVLPWTSFAEFNAPGPILREADSPSL